MSKIVALRVSDLSLDLNNFRTVPQKNEVSAVRAMIAISPDYFWGLTDSLVEDGYMPTENIIVLKTGTGISTVKEGNRRIGALKLLLGQIDSDAVGVPHSFDALRAALTSQWISDNSVVPCNVYELDEAATVDRIVTRTHGKNTKAGRDDWESVATARHNRSLGGREPFLDMLEEYLQQGKNLTQDQRDRWAGKYKVTVLAEAMQKIAARCGYVSAPDLAADYPNSKFRSALEGIMYAVGMSLLDFPTIRAEADFALRYGVSAIPPQEEDGQDVAPGASETSAEATTASPTTSASPATSEHGASTSSPTASAAPGSKEQAPAQKPSPAKPAAAALEDEKSVKQFLTKFKPHGPNRSKVETLRKEARKLTLKDNPIAFCFLLRSMMELMAKAYCQDHSLSAWDTKRNQEKVLIKLLGEVVTHMTEGSGTKDKEREKKLKPAMTELGKENGLLSIDFMNQLVHNPNTIISPTEIPIVFSRIRPLLEELNK